MSGWNYHVIVLYDAFAVDLRHVMEKSSWSFDQSHSRPRASWLTDALLVGDPNIPQNIHSLVHALKYLDSLRQVFANKGFSGETLETVVEVITSDRKLWVDTMLTEELGLEIEGPDPLRAGLATFAAFIVVGILPLIPFTIPDITLDTRFAASAVVTGVAFFGVGMAKGLVLGQRSIRSGIETLLTGGGAATLAYIVGAWLRSVFGAS